MTKYRILRAIFLVLGLVLVVVGLCTGEHVDVFHKATKICYECIGIG